MDSKTRSSKNENNLKSYNELLKNNFCQSCNLFHYRVSGESNLTYKYRIIILKNLKESSLSSNNNNDDGTLIEQFLV